MIDQLADETIERAVLACCLQDQHWDGTLEAVVAAGVTADWFTSQARRAVMRAVLSLHERGERVDLLSIRSLLGDADATAYAEAVYVDLHDGEQVGLYVDRLRGLVVRRRVHDLASRLMLRCVTDDNDREPALVAGQLVADLRAAAEVIDTGLDTGVGAVTLGEANEGVMASLERSPEEILGVPTGFSDIDALWLGLESGKVYVVGARPGVGKTTWALNAAGHVARGGRGVVYATLEMMSHELSERFLSASSVVDYRRLRTARLTFDEKGKVAHAARESAAYPLYLFDRGGVTLAEIRSYVRWARQRCNLAVLVVDYLQLVVAKGSSREQEVSSVARGLKNLAKNEGVAVLALSQLSREPDKRGPESRPGLADLRESGEIEQSADCVAFLYRPDIRDRTNPLLTGKAEFIIEKNRSGESRTVELRWDGAHQRYQSVARPHQVAQYQQYDADAAGRSFVA